MLRVRPKKRRNVKVFRESEGKTSGILCKKIGIGLNAV